mmetsp:Transcript_19828/g.45638  ORF Transcript_19828/g.45638 Transcript_19828/m.45638 type:complete len:570 (+) Transcript_19828:110-1819(+)
MTLATQHLVVAHAHKRGGHQHPVPRGLVCGDPHVEDVVCRLPSGVEHSSPQVCLVQGCLVVCLVGHVVLHRLEVHDGHQRHHLSGVGRLELLLPPVPSSRLQVQPRNVDAVLGGVRYVLGGLEVLHDELEVERVDGQLVPPRVRLQRARHEPLRVVEAGEPEGGGLPLLAPRREELDAALKVLDPRGEGFEAGVRHAGPVARHLVVLERLEHRLEVRRHDDEALDGLAELLEGRLHGLDELVEAVHLLQEHRVEGAHRAVVEHLEHAGCPPLVVHQVGHVLLKLLRHLVHQVLGALAPPLPPADAGLEHQHRVHDEHGLLQLEGDVGVVVHPKHLGVVDHGELLKVFHQLCVIPERRRVVDSRVREPVPVVLDHHLPLVVCLQDAHEATPVLVVRHPPPIVDVPGDVREGVPRHLVKLFDKHLKHVLGAQDVRGVELVPDVPPQGAVLAPLLHHGVEEGEADHKLLPVPVVPVPPPLDARLPLALPEGGEGADEVCAHALGGLVRELDAVLQHSHGEGGRGHGRKPQPEQLVLDPLRREPLHNLLQRAHPRHGEMAIHEAHPLALLGSR